MSFTRISTFLLLSVAVVGCESKKSDTTATTSPQSTSTASPTSAPTAAPAAAKISYPAPASFDMKPLAVGQWVRMAINTPGQPPSQTFVRIIGKEGDAFWYEIENNTPKGTTLFQILMDDATKSGFSKTAIKKMRIKTPAGIQEFSGPMLATVSAVADKFISQIGKPNLDKAERADITVAAGEFKGCYVHDIDENMMGIAIKTKSWNHPAVPINGFVRSEGTADGRTTVTHLVEMHMEGAKSAF